MSVKYRSNSGIANDRIKRKSQIDDSLTHLAETANSRDFVACASLADEYIRSFPESTALYRVASIFHRKSGNLQIAADYGEAYRIRKGGDLRNLLHLSKIYLKLGNHFRASALINRAGALSPGDSRVERLMSQLL
ncbi:MAG: hypothetical protein K8R21_11595 [Leptospira sp.]|nr:hypothetical protein [Leptospira sp.]